MKWASKPAAIAAAAVLAVVGVTGIGISQAEPATSGGSSSAVATDWGFGPGAPDGYGGGQGWGGMMPGSDYGTGYGSQDTSTTDSASLSTTAAGAAEEVSDSVVNIDTVLDYGTGEAAGTGIVLSSDGLVLTNHHVVEDATGITGTVVGTGKTYTATVLGYDPDTDIAVIQLSGASDLPVAALDDDDNLQVGDLVVGVGNTGGTGGAPTSVEGQVTELGATITASDQNGQNVETLEDLIGTDADIRSGQSGGPMVDSEGEVIGVNVAASSGGTGSQTTGYAIPIDQAKAVADQIIAGEESGSVQVGGTPFLGVQLTDTASASQGYAGGGFGGPDGFGYGTPGGVQDGTTDSGQVQSSSDDEGVAIAGVVSGTAAEEAGLTAGDTITALNGSAVTTAEQLSSVIAAAEVGDRMTIAWTDASGQDHTATVTLGAGPVG
jgi:S1-C subfamily serine protease